MKIVTLNNQWDCTCFFIKLCNMLINSVKYLMTVTSANAKTTHKEALLIDKACIENRVFNQVRLNKKPTRHKKNIAILYVLKGLDKWIKIIKPTIDNKYVLAVPISVSGNLNNLANKTSAAIDKKDVKEAGKARIKVCVINLPFCFPSFFSKARKKEGIPILNIDTKDIWDGCNG